jgi:hypothetical protein
MPLFTAIFAAIAVVICFVMWRKQVAVKREAIVRHFVLPRGLFLKLRNHHPDLTEKQCQLVAQGLRQFFYAYLKSGCQFVSMPSQVADDLWHEFILYTKEYQQFCNQAFGCFLHHTPAVVLSADKQNNTGIRRTWRYACKDENINARAPERIPLLFALDSKLKIPNGFRYIANCDGVRRAGVAEGSSQSIHCGGDFSSSSFDGGTSGLDFSNDGGSSDSSSDSGGSDSGGGGCGGGSSD